MAIPSSVIIGGGIGGQLLGMLGAGGAGEAAAATSGLDIGPSVSSVAGGGVAALMVIVGLVKKAMGK